MTHKFFQVGAAIAGWLAANVLGIVGAAGSSLLIAWLAVPPGMHNLLLNGLPVGIAQWIWLRRTARVSPLWVLTVPVGLYLGLLLSPLLSGLVGIQDDESLLAVMLGYTMVGCVIGLVQWLLLRGMISTAWLWILLNGAGLGLGIGLIVATDLIYRSGELAFVLAAVVYAAATGWLIPWLPAGRSKPEGELLAAA